MPSQFFIIAAIFGFLSVTGGAFASHLLREALPAERLDAWELAIRYAMYHTIALVVTSLMMERFPVRQIRFAGWSFVVGVILFSGSLSLLALTGQTWLGAITPFGGSAFLFGWAFLGIGVWRSTQQDSGME